MQRFKEPDDVAKPRFCFVVGMQKRKTKTKGGSPYLGKFHRIWWRVNLGKCSANVGTEIIVQGLLFYFIFQ